eukprot:m.179558 g.179558  ORF g.179558 m.179558 type:complete len:962 (+) comp39222_c0_seq3:351-3236(+)
MDDERSMEWFSLFMMFTDPRSVFAILYHFISATESAKQATRFSRSPSLHDLIQILGNKRAGKTSTLKTLTHLEYCSEEEATKGAETYNAHLATANWKIEKHPTSNFIPQLILATRTTEIMNKMYLFVFPLFSLPMLVILTYFRIFTNPLILFGCAFSALLFFSPKHSIIVRSEMYTFWRFWLLSDIFIAYLYTRKFSFYKFLLTAFSFYTLRESTFFRQLMGPLVVLHALWGINPGNVLSNQCFTIDPSVAYVGLLVGTALGSLAMAPISYCIYKLKPVQTVIHVLLLAAFILALSGGCAILLQADWFWQVQCTSETHFDGYYLCHLDPVTERKQTSLKSPVFWICAGSLLASMQILAKLVLLAVERSKKYLETILLVLSFIGAVFIALIDIPAMCPASFGISVSYLPETILVFILWKSNYTFESTSRSIKMHRTDSTQLWLRVAECWYKGEKAFLHPQLKIVDFGGEQLYYAMHHVFLRSRGVYLVVFSFETFNEKRKQDVIKWIKSAFAYGGKKSKAFLVGTHRDSCSPEKRKRIVLELNEAVQKCGRAVREFVYTIIKKPLSLVFEIENKGSRTDESITNLRHHIEKRIDIFRQESDDVDNFVYELEDEINDLKENSKIPPIMTKDEINETAYKKFGLTSVQVRKALLYLDDACVIMCSSRGSPYTGDHFDWAELNNYVIIRPQFLADVMALLLTPAEEQDCCILTHQKLSEILAEFNCLSYTNIALKFLEYYGFVLPMPNEEWAIVSRLPQDTVEPSWGKDTNDSRNFYIRFWNAEGIHQNIFDVLLSRLTQSSVDVQTYSRKWFRRSGYFDFRPTRELHAITYRIECHPFHEVFKVTVLTERNRQPHRLMKNLFELLNEIRKVFFPNIEFVTGPACPREDRCEETSTKGSHYHPMVGHIFPFLTTKSSLEEQTSTYLSLHCGKQELDHNDRDLSKNVYFWLLPEQKQSPSAEEFYP